MRSTSSIATPRGSEPSSVRYRPGSPPGLLGASGRSALQGEALQKNCRWSSGEAEFMEDAAHGTSEGLIVGVDRFRVVWPTSWTERPGGSQQGLDRLVSKNDQRGHRSETGGEGV